MTAPSADGTRRTRRFHAVPLVVLTGSGCCSGTRSRCSSCSPDCCWPCWSSVVATEVLVAVVIATAALDAIINDHSTTLPVMLVLSLLGFAGSVSIARFVADRDKATRWNVQPDRPPIPARDARTDREEVP